MTAITLAGTGSRSLALATPELKRSVWNELIAELEHWTRPNYIMSGGAEGFDHALALAAHHLNIPYILALPNRGYLNYYWTRNSVTKSDRSDAAQAMLDNAYKVEYVCNSLYTNGVHSNFIRNQFMVDNANTFVVYQPSSRGTADCVRRIKAASKPYVVLPNQALQA